LGQYGGHDVDLVVLVPHVGSAAERLLRSYPPLYEEEWRDDWAAFRLEGPPQVDIVVTSPGTKGDDHHRRAWELILADSELCAESKRSKRLVWTPRRRRSSSTESWRRFLRR
jgi:hypothetical protein